MKYFKVLITETGKSFGKNQEGYRVFNKTTETFSTLSEAKKWLSDKYGNVKRVKMFVDGKNGSPEHCGWIYCFKNADISHPWNEDGSKNQWLQQDWIQITEVKEKIVL